MEEHARDLLRSVGEAFKQVRQTEGLTQRQAAALADSTQARLCDIELGKGDPMLTTIQKWARAYGYEVEVSFIPIEEHPS